MYMDDINVVSVLSWTHTKWREREETGGLKPRTYTMRAGWWHTSGSGRWCERKGKKRWVRG